MSEPAGLEQDLEDLEAEITRLGLATSPDDRQALSEALLQRAFTLQTLGRLEDAVSAYGELPERLSEAPEEAVRRDVVRALQQRGHLLHELGRDAEAEEALGLAISVGARWRDRPQSRYERTYGVPPSWSTTDISPRRWRS